jgi:ATP-dependent protease HslVU (ClpYQ) peptidase subunit
MTCIVGVEHSNKVYIAGDLQGTGYNEKIHHLASKVFKIGNLVFGYTSSYRFGQLIEANLTDPYVPEGDQIYLWLIRKVIPEIRDILVKADEKGGNALIGVKNELYELQSDYSILRSTRKYNAVGSGEDYAVGSIHQALKEAPLNEWEPRSLLKCAIETAHEFSPSVGKKFTIQTT